ncbi:hypothetical protein BC628DRAFT_1092475 [Trametes gibbosa]|nr:hypothetical protein BC628DRAFT_1092475 [Trametes gibbosa]
MVAVVVSSELAIALALARHGGSRDTTPPWTVIPSVQDGHPVSLSLASVLPVDVLRYSAGSRPMAGRRSSWPRVDMWTTLPPANRQIRIREFFLLLRSVVHAGNDAHRHTSLHCRAAYSRPRPHRLSTNRKDVTSMRHRRLSCMMSAAHLQYRSDSAKGNCRSTVPGVPGRPHRHPRSRSAPSTDGRRALCPSTQRRRAVDKARGRSSCSRTMWLLVRSISSNPDHRPAAQIGAE